MLRILPGLQVHRVIGMNAGTYDHERCQKGKKKQGKEIENLDTRK